MVATCRGVSPLTFFLSKLFEVCFGILKIVSSRLWVFIFGGSFESNEFSSLTAEIGDENGLSLVRWSGIFSEDEANVLFCAIDGDDLLFGTWTKLSLSDVDA